MIYAVLASALALVGCAAHQLERPPVFLQVGVIDAIHAPVDTRYALFVRALAAATPTQPVGAWVDLRHEIGPGEFSVITGGLIFLIPCSSQMSNTEEIQQVSTGVEPK